ncbi:MAG: hypothetical protein JRC86_09660 [Deltaproteobacteria bacterium]|nr:hypothetical protein [Deltaproteobacteria bacterium]
MTGALSDYLENKLIDLTLTGAAYTPPPAVYLALLSALPDDTGAVEVVYTGYARTVLSFSAASSRAVAQDATSAFPLCGGGSDTATHYGIYDASSGGNLLGYGEFVFSKLIKFGSTPTVLSGEVTLTFVAGKASDYLAEKLLDHAFSATAYTPPTNTYLAMTLADLTDASTGSTISEPVDTYTRKLTSGWTVTGSSAVNVSDEIFPIPTAEWGPILAVAVTDALSAGNVLLYDNSPLGDGQSPENGDTVIIEAGAYTVSID